MTEETLKRMLIDNIGIREFAEELGTEIGDIICDNISCQRCFFSGKADCEKKLRKYCRKMFAGSGRSKHPHTRMAMYDMTEKSITCPNCGYEYCCDDTPTNIHREIKYCLHCGIVFAGYANKDRRKHPHTGTALYDMAEKSITCPQCGYEYCWDDTPTNILREIKCCLHCGIVFAGYANKDGR